MTSRPCGHRLLAVKTYWSSKPPSDEKHSINLEVNTSIIQHAANLTISGKSSPSADHLLHLIYYNVFRALYRNKEILSQTAISLVPDHDDHPKILSPADFPSYAVTFPATSDLPGCLAPTELQMNLTHSTWISVLPFPRMRENLVLWDLCYDHSEMVNDLVGDLVDGKKYRSSGMVQTPPSPSPSPDGTGQLVISESEDDEVTTSRNGLIVWGEPYRMESWEVTPGFLRKWAWAVEGCDELIRSSNRWRMIRGEGPLTAS
ncbi:hypothetical protein P170DRAFT_239279 [Aspergillus steynii IBT 23096]|uniref:Uncharacterized protein n=1 Tax=Aspergillus steynii IBT 23096 TaxID=1392250 RepID=A0A2I2G374_9EURO|nr:uncharacterized protein P170DRAFT_239279 [Aspergillus steynii IBT 23096]PLB47336.1 hypothetical protein P170DRAFT_239279 [Aspergillus steynii IBT 23096]